VAINFMSPAVFRPVLLVGVSLVQLILAGCSGSNRNPAGLKFSKAEYDLGVLVQGISAVNRTLEFDFENIGSAEIVILGVETSCSCLEVRFPQGPIRPGETGKITLTLGLEGKSGFISSSANVRYGLVDLAEGDLGQVLLRCSATVLPVTKLLSDDIDFGATSPFARASAIIRVPNMIPPAFPRVSTQPTAFRCDIIQSTAEKNSGIASLTTDYELIATINITDSIVPGTFLSDSCEIRVVAGSQENRFEVPIRAYIAHPNVKSWPREIVLFQGASRSPLSCEIKLKCEALAMPADSVRLAESSSSGISLKDVFAGMDDSDLTVSIQFSEACKTTGVCALEFFDSSWPELHVPYRIIR